MKSEFWIAGLFVLAVLAGCGQTPKKSVKGASRGSLVQPLRVEPGIDLSDSGMVKAALYEQYEEWKGTPHGDGGMSKRGIDCSGFMLVTFKSRLGILLPRTTDSQVLMGSSVKKSQLRTGDLVFFKTGSFRRHVGVYLEKGKFLHTSSKYGVSISNLNHGYWKSAYWKAKRLEM